MQVVKSSRLERPRKLRGQEIHTPGDSCDTFSRNFPNRCMASRAAKTARDLTKCCASLRDPSLTLRMTAYNYREPQKYRRDLARVIATVRFMFTARASTILKTSL